MFSVACTEAAKVMRRELEKFNPKNQDGRERIRGEILFLQFERSKQLKVCPAFDRALIKLSLLVPVVGDGSTGPEWLVGEAIDDLAYCAPHTVIDE